MADEVDRWQWEALFASAHGPKKAATRHVLHVLRMHLFKDTKSIFPSQKRIAEMTGLEVKAVGRHLEHAVKSGWLKRRENKRRGKVGVWHQYIPTIPARLKRQKLLNDNLSRSENPLHDNLNAQCDITALSIRHSVPVDPTGCRTNQVLNQAPNQVLSKSEAPESFDNDVSEKTEPAAPIRPGRNPILDEAESLARETGFPRDRGHLESPQHYLDAVRAYRDRPTTSPELRKKLSELLPINSHLVRRPP